MLVPFRRGGRETGAPAEFPAYGLRIGQSAPCLSDHYPARASFAAAAAAAALALGDAGEIEVVPVL